jgi:hypothetical protein
VATMPPAEPPAQPPAMPATSACAHPPNCPNTAALVDVRPAAVQFPEVRCTGTAATFRCPEGHEWTLFFDPPFAPLGIAPHQLLPVPEEPTAPGPAPR